MGKTGKIIRAALGAALACSLAPALPASALADEGAQAQPTESQTQGACAPGEALVVYRAEGAGAAGTGRAMLLDGGDALSEAGFTVEQTWDVSAPDANAGIEALAEGDGAEAAPGAEPDPADADLRIALVSKGGESTIELLAELNALDCVEVAEPNLVISPTAAELGSVASPQTASPNDTFYDDWQYNLHGTDAGIDTGALRDVQAASPSTDESIVAVLDTGVDFTHPDLAGRAWENPGNIGLEGEHGYDFGDGDDDPSPNDDGRIISSHGTHVAGIVAAAADNAEGVAGVSSRTKIMSLKYAPAGGIDEPYLSGAVAAYQYLIQAKVAGENVVAVNNSWIIRNTLNYRLPNGYSAVLEYVVNQAGKAGILSVFGAGNDGRDVESDQMFGICDATASLESPYALYVAGSNQNNEYSFNSSFSATSVDVAAPSTLILAPVDTRAPETFFSALLSHQAGEQLLVYDDFSGLDPGSLGEYSWRLLYESADGVQTVVSSSDTAQRVVELGQATAHGDPALRVRLSITGLERVMEQIDPAWSLDANEWYVYAALSQGFRFEITKTIENPFKGGDSDTGRFFASVTPLIDEGMSTMSMAYATPVVRTHAATDEGAEGASMMSGDAWPGSSRDNYLNVSEIYDVGSGSTALTSVDTESDLIDVGFALAFRSMAQGELPMAEACREGTADEIWVSATVTGLGIGTAERYQAYTVFSGTSMASPHIAGAIAELAQLYPDESPLELRGRVVGSTVGMEPRKNFFGLDPVTATDGRFSFGAGALGGGSALSANTWSAEADVAAGTVTLRGRGLGDAAVLGDDGEELAVLSRAEDGSWLTVRVGPSVFDGAKHRFDVADASTGKTHKAAYTMPTAEGSGAIPLTRVLDLPEAAGGAGRTVSTPAGLVHADGLGSYAYLCEDPAAEGARWERIDAPGLPWAEDTSDGGARSLLTYGYANGTLYAMATDGVPQDDGDSFVALYVATLDLSRGAEAAWSPYTEYRLSKSPAGCEAWTVRPLFTSAGGDAYIYVYNVMTDEVGEATWDYPLLRAPAGSADFEVLPIDEVPLLEISIYLVGGESLGAVACQVDGTFIGASYDAAAGAWDTCELDSAPEMRHGDLWSLPGSVAGAAGNGAVLVGKGFGSLGDMVLVDLDAKKCIGLGSIGARASEGYAVQDVVMFGGAAYVAALDMGTTGEEAASTRGALYALPAEVAEKLGSLDHAVTAKATEGGAARVADWQGEAGQELKVRAGDTAAWMAEAADGYRFAGWYDEAGELTSTDATFEQAIFADSSLQARFAKAEGEGAEATPADPANPSAPDGAEPGGGEAGTDADAAGEALDESGDATAPLVAIAAGAALASLAAATIARRRMRNGN